MEEITASSLWEFVRSAHESKSFLQLELIFFCWLFSRQSVSKITTAIRELKEALSEHSENLSKQKETIDDHEQRINVVEIAVRYLKNPKKGES